MKWGRKRVKVAQNFSVGKAKNCNYRIIKETDIFKWKLLLISAKVFTQVCVTL
jgi:hypothetical protein